MHVLNNGVGLSSWVALAFQIQVVPVLDKWWSSTELVLVVVKLVPLVVLVCLKSGGWSAGYLVLVLGSRPPNQ